MTKRSLFICCRIKGVAVTRESLKKHSCLFCPLAQALLAFYSCHKNGASVCSHFPTSILCLSALFWFPD